MDHIKRLNDIMLFDFNKIHTIEEHFITLPLGMKLSNFLPINSNDINVFYGEYPLKGDLKLFNKLLDNLIKLEVPFIYDAYIGQEWRFEPPHFFFIYGENGVLKYKYVYHKEFDEEYYATANVDYHSIILQYFPEYVDNFEKIKIMNII